MRIPHPNCDLNLNQPLITSNAKRVRFLPLQLFELLYEQTVTVALFYRFALPYV